MKTILTILSLLLICFLCEAQNTAQYPYTSYELNVAAKNGELMPSFSLNNFGGRQFKIGFAFRLNSFWSKKKTYITAPASLTSGKTGPGVFFADQIHDNIDTIEFHKSKTHSLNVALITEYNVSSQWAVGFNIDVLGVSFGPAVKGQYTDWNQAEVEAKPTRFNFLLVSDNDIGNLNSELYVKYFLKSNPYYLKAGGSFYFNEYTTLEEQRLENDRFRYKSLSPVVGVGRVSANLVF